MTLPSPAPALRSGIDLNYHADARIRLNGTLKRPVPLSRLLLAWFPGFSRRPQAVAVRTGKDRNPELQTL